MGKKMMIYLALFRSVPAFWLYLLLPEEERKKVNSDLQKMGGVASLAGLHRALYRKGNCFRNLFYARTGKYHPRITKFAKIFWRPMFGLEIDVADGIGGGMRIYHGYSTIVFAKEIGTNFTVYQNVTLGRGKMVNENDIPIIGNNVTIYTGAIVIGGVRIGDGVKIGAGAVVVKDVPADTTVVGAPERIINRKDGKMC